MNNIVLKFKKSQMEALKLGAKRFIFPIDKKYKIDLNNEIVTFRDEFDSLRWNFLKELSPVQKGEQNICIEYNDKISDYILKECLDVRFIRVKDLVLDNLIDILGEITINDSLIYVHEKVKENFKIFYNNLMKEFKLKNKYDDNDYVVLIKFKI